MSTRRQARGDSAAARDVAALAAEPARRLERSIVDRVIAEMGVDLGDKRPQLEGINVRLDEPREDVQAKVAGLQAAEQAPRPAGRYGAQRQRGRPSATHGNRFRRSFNDHPYRLGPRCEVLTQKVDTPFAAPDLILATAVEAGALAFDSYILGHLMGLREARAAVARAGLKGDLQACDDDVSEQLYCFTKLGPRLTDQEADGVFRAAIGFGSSAVPVNRDFPVLFDKTVQAFRDLLLTDDEQFAHDSTITEAVVINSVLALAENLTAHVPDSLRARAADLHLDVWEAYDLVEAVAPFVATGCIPGPWPVVVQFTNRRGLEHLWMVREAVGVLLDLVGRFDLDQREAVLDVDDDVVAAIGCLVAMSDLTPPKERREIASPRAGENGGQPLGPGRPALVGSARPG